MQLLHICQPIHFDYFLFVFALNCTCGLISNVKVRYIEVKVTVRFECFFIVLCDLDCWTYHDQACIWLDVVCYLKVRTTTAVWILERMFVCFISSEPMNLLRPKLVCWCVITGQKGMPRWAFFPMSRPQGRFKLLMFVTDVLWSVVHTVSGYIMCCAQQRQLFCHAGDTCTWGHSGMTCNYRTILWFFFPWFTVVQKIHLRSLWKGDGRKNEYFATCCWSKTTCNLNL